MRTRCGEGLVQQGWQSGMLTIRNHVYRLVPFPVRYSRVSVESDESEKI